MVRKYDINETYFDVIDTEEKAYMLGFLYSDGYNNVEKHEVKIRLSKSDEDILIKFRNILYPNKDKPLYYHKRDNHIYSELNISNKHISDTLEKHGCGQAKTFNLEFPFFIDDSLYHHFIRGVFDGDGSICCVTLKSGEHKTMFSIIGYRPFISSINNIISKSCGLNENKLIDYTGKDERIATLARSGCRQCIIIRDYLYKDATIYMQRKYDKFFALGTDEWKTYENLKVNLYERTIKITDRYNNPEEKNCTDYLVCCNCEKHLDYRNKVYDKDTEIFCHKCFSNLFPVYVKRKENEIKIYDSNTLILRIKDVDVLFDAEDIDKVEQYKWGIGNGRVFCNLRKLKKCVYLNRLIMNAKDGESIAFKNGNTFDMRKENLERRNHR